MMVNRGNIPAMKDFFSGLLTGIVLMAATGWYWVYGRKNEDVRQAQTSVGTALHQAVDAVEARIDAFELRGKDIKEDLTHTGKVVREKARAVGVALGDATSDTRITTAIQAKLLADRQLSVWKVDVSTTDGMVTLSGTVSTHDQIGRAMLVALETPGVRRVTSTIQVKP